MYDYDSPVAEEGASARAGQPLPEGVSPASEDQVIEALRTVYDPEIPVNIYDLGLVYKNTIDERGNAEIVMTLTAPACPVAGEMPGQVAQTVAALDGIGEVNVTLTWEPPWSTERMTEVARVALDMF